MRCPYVRSSRNPWLFGSSLAAMLAVSACGSSTPAPIVGGSSGTGDTGGVGTGVRPTSSVSASGPEGDASSAGATSGAPTTSAVDAGTTTAAGSSSGGSATTGQTNECAQWSMQTPQPGASEEIAVAGQQAWRHDEGHEYGIFNTFDALVACEGAVARKVHVLLPRDYDSERRDYPVVYFNDGHTTFWPGGLANQTWDVAHRLSEQDPCALDKVIVVAVHPLDRDAEYTHTDAGGATCCGVEAYADYLADCLKPFIDANYRTRSEPAATAIAGSSHGGLAAFLTATLRSDSFGRAIAMSSSFWAGLQEGDALADSLLLELAGPGLADPEQAPTLWIDWGLVREGGYHNEVIEANATLWSEALVDLLQSDYGYSIGEDLFTFADDDGGHEENAWSTRIGPALLALFPYSQNE